MSISELNKKQKYALDCIKKGSNIFVTGAAGVGKSYLISKVIDEIEDVHITSSTGISAVNISGKTIHSWAGLGFAEGTPAELWKAVSVKKHIVFKIRKTKKLIIDEISMIDADLFDKIDYVLRSAKNSARPFGGIQIILFGDCLQLPPIQKKGEEKKFFFESKAYKKAGFQEIELDEVVRQDDSEFVNALHEMRLGEHGLKTINLINSRIKKNPAKGIAAIHLMTHNAQVDGINATKLAAIKEQAHKWVWTTEGEDAAVKILEKGCPVPKELELKVGAQVMCVYNIFPDKEIVNGSIGVVTGFDSGHPIVKFNNGIEQVMKRVSWEIQELRGDALETIASLKQYPLKLGWAISIHKSQGQTIDHAIVNLSRCFEFGQAYVALSRLKSIGGLYLEGIDWNTVMAHPTCVEFHKNIRK